MKRLIFSLVLTFLGGTLAAQNTFCDAKEMAENQQIYQELANEIAQQKAKFITKISG